MVRPSSNCLHFMNVQTQGEKELELVLRSNSEQTHILHCYVRCLWWIKTLLWSNLLHIQSAPSEGEWFQAFFLRVFINQKMAIIKSDVFVSSVGSALWYLFDSTWQRSLLDQSVACLFNLIYWQLSVQCAEILFDFVLLNQVFSDLIKSNACKWRPAQISF